MQPNDVIDFTELSDSSRVVERHVCGDDEVALSVNNHAIANFLENVIETNFENRPVYDEVVCRLLGVTLLGHQSVCK